MFMKLDDWNDVLIRGEGNYIRHWLNGRLILDFTENDPEKGSPRGCSPCKSTQASRCGPSIGTSA
jgi:hypothetical protein